MDARDQQQPKLKGPSIPSTGEKGEKTEYEMMKSIKRVIDYLNISYYEALELSSDVFLLAAKNHYIDELNSTEEGREYLKLCNRLNTTELDEVGFRKLKSEVSN